jgi:hypothetical protein
MIIHLTVGWALIAYHSCQRCDDVNCDLWNQLVFALCENITGLFNVAKTMTMQPRS